MEKVLKISDLNTVRLLADPLKLELLKAFAEEETTTKDVAKALGENVTKLYRHVDALLAAGLLEIVSERPKRGTVERTFRAVASRFEVDHTLFMSDDGKDSSDAIRDMLRAGETEILESLASKTDADEQILFRMRIKASPARLQSLRELLVDWLAQAEEEDESSEEQQEAGALIAFYPIKSK